MYRMRMLLSVVTDVTGTNRLCTDNSLVAVVFLLPMLNSYLVQILHFLPPSIVVSQSSQDMVLRSLSKSRCPFLAAALGSRCSSWQALLHTHTKSTTNRTKTDYVHTLNVRPDTGTDHVLLRADILFIRTVIDRWPHVISDSGIIRLLSSRV